LNFPLSAPRVNKEYYKIIKKRFLRVRKPYDVMFHLNAVPFLPENKPFVIFLDAALQHKTVYEKALLIFTFSDCLRDFMIKKYKIEPRKVLAVGAGPNFGLLPKIAAKKYRGKTILFVGNAVYRKGGLVLLKAFKKVKSKIKDARLIMVSSQFDSNSARQTVKNLKKVDIFIKGFSNKRTLGAWYRKADVFVLPSLNEPFGIVLLEAMAYKLPCIGTKRFALREIIEDGKTGFLVKSNSHSELADRIVFLLKHPEVSRKMGEAGYQKVIKYYNWDKVVETMLTKIKKILNNKN
jgi:glycosyltransferase involved in cell wall biosynthesis